jgi:hypothetical protein
VTDVSMLEQIRKLRRTNLKGKQKKGRILDNERDAKPNKCNLISEERE